MDHGEFETQDGNIVVLKKNSQVSYNIYQISLKIKIEMVDNIAKHKMNLFSDKPQHSRQKCIHALGSTIIIIIDRVSGVK